MNKICTTIEQSKKLIELGIDINIADMFWLNRHIDLTETKYELCVVDRSNEHIDFFNSYAVAVDNNEIIPAWSLAALLDVLPEGIIANYYVPNLQKENGKYSIAYGNDELLCIADNPVDACYELILILKEKDLI